MAVVNSFKNLSMNLNWSLDETYCLCSQRRSHGAHRRTAHSKRWQTTNETHNRCQLTIVVVLCVCVYVYVCVCVGNFSCVASYFACARRCVENLLYIIFQNMFCSNLLLWLKLWQYARANKNRKKNNQSINRSINQTGTDSGDARHQQLDGARRLAYQVS